MSKTMKGYSTSTCPYCAKAKAFLEENNIEFEVFDVGQDRNALKKMMKIFRCRECLWR